MGRFVSQEDYINFQINQESILERRRSDNEEAAKSADLQRLRDEEALEKQGFYIHTPFDDPTTPIGVNIHTHGLPDTHNHLDFQIVVGLDPATVLGIFLGLVDRIKKGERFRDDQVVEGVIEDRKVKMLEVDESGRQVLRIILPDPDGEVEIDKMNENCQFQHIIPDKKEDK